MLPAQQRRRHHHRHLAAVERSGKGGTKGDFGLAETDVTADQPVHGPPAAQVGHGVVDGLGLFFGLGIGKAGREFFIDSLLDGDTDAGFQLPGRGDTDQLIGHVADALLQPRLAGLPGSAAEPVEPGAGFLGAIARNDLDVLDRQKQLVAAVVKKPQAIMGRAADLDGVEPVETANAVVYVNHQVAGAEHRCLGDEVLGPDPWPGRAAHAVAQDVGFGNYRQPPGLQGSDEPALQPDHRQSRLLGVEGGRVLPLFDRPQARKPVFVQQRGQAVHRALGKGGDDDAAAFGLLFADMVAKGVEDVGIGPDADVGEVVSRPGPGIDGAWAIVRHGKGRQSGHGAVRQQAVPILGVEKQRLRRHRMIRRPRRAKAGFWLGVQEASPGGVIFGDQVEPRVPRLFGLMVEDNPGFGGVVQKRFQLFVKQRQPVFHADVAVAGGDGAVKRIVVAGLGKQHPVTGSEPGNGAVVEHHLADRLQFRRFQLSGGALAGGVEGAQGFQFVTEEIEPQGLGGAGRKDIDDAAARRVFAGLHHRVGAEIAVRRKETTQVGRVQALPGLQGHDRVGEGFLGRDALQQRRHRRQDHPALPFFRRPQHPRQGIDAAADQFRPRRHPVIGQAVPGREFELFQAGGEKRKGLGLSGHTDVVARYHENVATFGGQRDQQKGVEAFRHAADQKPVACLG